MASVDDGLDRETVDLMNVTNLEYVMRSGGYDPDSVRGWVRRAAAHLGIDQASMTSPEEAAAFLDLVLAASFDIFEKNRVPRAAAHATLAALINAEAPLQERLDLGLPDDGDDAWTAELQEMDADGLGYHTLMAKTGRRTIALVVPEGLQGIKAADIWTERWERAQHTGDFPERVVELARAVTALDELRTAYEVADEWGASLHWDMPYTDDDPFCGALETLTSPRQVGAEDLQDAMEQACQGSAALIAGALNRIDSDHAALMNATRNDDSASESRRDITRYLGSALTTVERYEALRGLFHSPMRDTADTMLREARNAGLEVALVRSLTGDDRAIMEGPRAEAVAEKIINMVRDGRLEDSIEWTADIYPESEVKKKKPDKKKKITVENKLGIEMFPSAISEMALAGTVGSDDLLAVMSAFYRVWLNGFRETDNPLIVPVPESQVVEVLLARKGGNKRRGIDQKRYRAFVHHVIKALASIRETPHVYDTDRGDYGEDDWKPRYLLEPGHFQKGWKSEHGRTVKDVWLAPRFPLSLIEPRAIARITTTPPPDVNMDDTGWRLWERLHLALNTLDWELREDKGPMGPNKYVDIPREIIANRGGVPALEGPSRRKNDAGEYVAPSKKGIQSRRNREVNKALGYLEPMREAINDHRREQGKPEIDTSLITERKRGTNVVKAIRVSATRSPEPEPEERTKKKAGGTRTPQNKVSG